MAFVTIRPGQTQGDNVRVAFYQGRFNSREQKNSLLLQMQIGEQIIEKISLKSGDTISFSYNEDDPNIWFLHKSPFGHKLQPKQGKYYPILFTWKVFPISEQDRKRRTVEHELYNGGLKIFWKKRENINEKENPETKSA